MRWSFSSPLPRRLCAVITPYGGDPCRGALLTDWQDGREHYYVLMEYRLPRLLLALFVGAALAVAGVLVQGLCVTRLHHRIFSALTMPPALPLWEHCFLCHHYP